MNSNTYAQMENLNLLEPLRALGPIAIDERIPDGEVHRGGQLFGRVYGGELHHRRPLGAPTKVERKAKRKAARDARKRNRGA